MNKAYDYKRFAFYSGQEDMKTRKQIVDTYTNSENKHGKDLRILLISSAGAEGLDLKNIRKVLIMDVFWHDVRIQQIIGRAVRKKSHYDLPENERNVKPILYLSVFTPKQKELSKEKVSTDEYIYELAKKKLRLNNDVLSAVKESAIDCMLNQCENRDKCYRFLGKKEGLAYLPRIQDDIVYGYKHAHTKEIQKELVVAGITNLGEIVYKKGKEWFLGNGEKLKKKPEIVKGKKFGLDLESLDLFNYDSIKKQGVPLKVGMVNETSGKFNEV
jgi:superfamily II DNA or RNA helicase